MEEINFNESRNLSEIIRTAVQFLKLESRNLLRYYTWWVFPLFIPLAILTYHSELHAISGLINNDMEQLEAALPTLDWKKIWLAVLAQAFVWLVFLSVTLVYLRNYSNNKGRLLTNKEMWNELLYEFPKIFIVQFFYISMVIFGLVSFVIPGIYFGVSLALATTIVVFEDSKIFHALSKSFRLIGSKWFMSLGYLFVFYLIYIGARTLLLLPVSLIAGNLAEAGEISQMNFAITSTINAIINMLASIFPILGSVLLYHKLMKDSEISTKAR
ncbi:MAG TPA: hypothetical protein VKX30_05230 [Flavobacteriaceae bacterium]|nr:hypothetical protein [Flavobacteriaceae bacterium]